MLVANKKWNSAVNRLYYAVYYAVSALLVKNEIEAKTHAGVFGYPLEATTRIAIPAVMDSLAGTDMDKVILVCFDEQAYGVYLSVFEEVVERTKSR